MAVVHFNHCLTDICHKKTLNGRRHEEISIRIAFFLATYSSCQFAKEMRGTQILMGQHNCWTLELLFGGWTLSNYVIHFWAHHHHLEPFRLRTINSPHTPWGPSGPVLLHSCAVWYPFYTGTCLPGLQRPRTLWLANSI